MLRQNDEATHIEYFFIKLDDAVSIEYDSESPMRIFSARPKAGEDRLYTNASLPEALAISDAFA